MRIAIFDTAFDPLAELARYQAEAFPRGGDFGATAVFIGSMRDLNEGEAVQAMTLEHYPGMTERHLRRIAEEAMARWPLLDVCLLHRVGQLEPGDPIVCVAAWSAHRAAALEACRFLIDDLKHRAPFWKKEELPEGSRWVERNT